ncbi:MAG: site-2 protease family protein [Clostridia bacterium]|nr:site-2 protease family protein [Clostridia bacterium]
MPILYILLALAAFCILILIHEAGHFVAARIFGVTVLEFSIGMGPKLFSHTSKRSGTMYAVRLLPIGGYVRMAGEDEESDDPNAFNNKAVWKRMIITAAGAFMNIVFGIIVMTFIVISSKGLASNVIYSFDENAVSQSTGLMVNDRILKFDGRKIHTGYDLSYAVTHDGTKPVSVLVLRNGNTVLLKNVTFGIQTEKGVAFGLPDFIVYAEEKNVPNVIKHAFYRSCNSITMIWESLIDLITGRYGIEAMSGPVGVTEAISTAAKSGSTQFLNLLVLISMNLGIFNLLPLPALDGGRLFFMLIELIFRKPIDKNIEGYIHFAGIVILLAFMALISFKDIVNIFR